MGIHGEPGIRREPMIPADVLAARMVAQLLESLQMNGKAAEEVAVLVNGFGGTPLQELYLLNHAVMRELHARGIAVYKVFVGNYMTSIDMAKRIRLDHEAGRPAEAAACRRMRDAGAGRARPVRTGALSQRRR